VKRQKAEQKVQMMTKNNLEIKETSLKHAKTMHRENLGKLWVGTSGAQVWRPQVWPASFSAAHSRPVEKNSSREFSSLSILFSL